MSRQSSLEAELEHVTKLNETVTSMIDTIRLAQANIVKTKSATDSTSALLEDWIKILNQTTFVTKALKDPTWEGVEVAELAQQQQQLLLQEKELQKELESLQRQNEALQRLAGSR